MADRVHLRVMSTFTISVSIVPSPSGAASTCLRNHSIASMLAVPGHRLSLSEITPCQVFLKDDAMAAVL